MSTKCHPKNVHEKSPKKRTSRGHFCPRDVAKSVHEMSPLLSTRCHLLCPRNVCHPCAAADVAVFYFAKSRQDHSLAGPTSCVGPVVGVEAHQSCRPNYHASMLEVQPHGLATDCNANADNWSKFSYYPAMNRFFAKTAYFYIHLRKKCCSISSKQRGIGSLKLGHLNWACTACHVV